MLFAVDALSQDRLKKPVEESLQFAGNTYKTILPSFWKSIYYSVDESFLHLFIKNIIKKSTRKT